MNISNFDMRNMGYFKHFFCKNTKIVLLRRYTLKGLKFEKSLKKGVI